MSEETKKSSWFGTWTKGVKAEYKKISWPTKDDLTKETISVVCVTVVLGILITVIDNVIRSGISFIIG